MDFDSRGPYLNIKNKELAMAPFPVQAECVLSILSNHKALMATLDQIKKDKIPNCYIGGGSVPQIVWNHFHKFDQNHGINDFDVVYFDSKDLSQEAEANIQTHLASALASIPIRIEAINEARVHLWYEKELGKAMEPYTQVEDAIYCFPMTASSVGVRLTESGAMELYAPHGLTDLLGEVARPNRVQITKERYLEKTSRWKEVWPRLTIAPW